MRKGITHTDTNIYREQTAKHKLAPTPNAATFWGESVWLNKMAKPKNQRIPKTQ